MNGVVITGPTGAIGMALIKKCIEEKRKVLAICHKGSTRIKQIPDSEYVEVLEADLADYSRLFLNEKPKGEYDVFIHLAWNGTFGNTRNDMPLQVDNISYTLDACELAKRMGCEIFIGAGSQAEYGRVDEPLKPETPAFPENGYGMAKLAAGQMSRIKCEQLGLKHIWTRILSVYGPYDGEYTMVMSTLKKMLDNEETHFTAGEQVWNYLYSEDAAEMILYLSKTGIANGVYLLGSKDVRKLREFITSMYFITNCKSRLGLGDIPYAEKQVMSLTVDDRHMDEYEAIEFTPFEKGIVKTISYLKGREQ